MADEQNDHHYPDSQNSFKDWWDELSGLGALHCEAENGVGFGVHNANEQHSVHFDNSNAGVQQAWPVAIPVTTVDQYLGSDTVNQPPITVPCPGTPFIGSVKQERNQANPSPDSGYNQPYSNESATNNNHEAFITARKEIVSVPDIREMVDTRTPSKTNYAGPYGFDMSFEQTDYAVKNANYTHSREVDKLYSKMNVPCPVQFHCLKDPPAGARVRAMMVYMRDEQSHDAVTRCPTHIMNQDSRPHLARHLVQTVASDDGYDQSSYDTSAYNRNSVVVPISKPAVGEQCFTVLYKFMCLSSCVGGINRRPVVVVFTLEDCNGEVLGRRCIEVKICSSPGRDRKQDENRKRKKEAPQGSVPVVLPKKPKMVVVETPKSRGDGGDEIFLLRVKGRAKYEILKQINDGLTLRDMATESQMEQLRQQDDNMLQSFLENINHQVS